MGSDEGGPHLQFGGHSTNDLVGEFRRARLTAYIWCGNAVVDRGGVEPEDERHDVVGQPQPDNGSRVGRRSRYAGPVGPEDPP